MEAKLPRAGERSAVDQCGGVDRPAIGAPFHFEGDVATERTSCSRTISRGNGETPALQTKFPQKRPDSVAGMLFVPGVVTSGHTDRGRCRISVFCEHLL